MAPISLAKSNFFALVLESVFYGGFTVLFFAALWVITVRRSVVNYKLLVTLVAMWLISTTHWILDVIRAVDAFVNLANGGADGYYGDLSNPLQAAKTALYVFLTVVGDGFAIYRCYIVWGQKWWIIAIPLLLLCGTATAGIGATIAFVRAAPGTDLFLPAIVPWITSFIAMTFSTNIVCTLMIAYRIQRIRSKLRNVVYSSAGHSTVIIFIESAAIYASAVLLLLVAYTLSSNFQYTVLDTTAPLIGITFAIIILRVSLGISSRELETIIPTSDDKRSPQSLRLRSQAAPVAVNVSHLVEIDKDRSGEASSIYGQLKV